MKKRLLVASVFLLTLTSFAQTSKNTWLLGGSASYSSTQEGDLHNTVLDISPRVGYFILNDFAVGLNANINTTKDEGSNVSVASFGPYARYYFAPLGKNAKLFANAQVIFGNEDEGMGKSNLSGWGLSAGPAFFINESIAFETTIGYTSTKAGIEQVKDNTLAFGIGLQIHFGNKK